MDKSRNSGKKNRKQSTSDSPNISREGFEVIKPLNYIQNDYLSNIKSNSIIYGIGSAGTGKTFVATAYAASELYYRNVNKVILTRPNVEVGRGLGFLPGELDDKYAPYLEPFKHILVRCLGQSFFDYAIKVGLIEPRPLGFLRGANFDNCIVLADEMQNATVNEMKMFLSRIGENCKMIINGDPEQIDIPNSGLEEAINKTQHIPDIAISRFRPEDIVRSTLCKAIILAYNK